MNQFEYRGVEAEKAEAMRRYNNRRSFRDRNILRFAAVALLCYLWFPTVATSLQTVAGLIYRTGSVLMTDRAVVFVFVNLLVALIFLLSGESDVEESSRGHDEPDLYDQYTSSFSAVIVTAPEEKVVEVDDDWNKQLVPAAVVEEAVTTKNGESNKEIVPAYLPEVSMDEASEEAVITTTRIYRRTKSEAKKEISGLVTEYRRTESSKEVELERLSSEEFRLKVESFIMEKKRNLILESDVVQCHGRLLGSTHATTTSAALPMAMAMALTRD